MKFLFILLTCFFSVTGVFAQQQLPPPPPYDSTKSDERIFTSVEVEAGFAGGDEGWRKFLMANLEMDKISKKIRIPKGETEVRQTVIVKFIVSINGSISNVSVENEDCNKLFKAEAIRVITSSPDWIPAQQNGRKVNAYRRQPITFLIAKD